MEIGSQTRRSRLGWESNSGWQQTKTGVQDTLPRRHCEDQHYLEDNVRTTFEKSAKLPEIKAGRYFVLLLKCNI